MPPTDEPGRRYRAPRHGGPDPRWGGPGEADQVDDPYGDVTADRVRPVGRHGAPDDGARYDDRGAAGYEDRLGVATGRRDDLPGGRPAPAWPPATALPSGPPRDGFADGVPESRFGADGRPPTGPSFGQVPLSPPYGQASSGSPTPPPPGRGGYPSPPRGVPGPTDRSYPGTNGHTGGQPAYGTGPQPSAGGPGPQASGPFGGRPGAGQGPYGRPANGHGPNGHGPANGQGTNGQGTNGHGSFGPTATGPGSSGQAPSGQGPYGQGSYGQPSTGQGSYGPPSDGRGTDGRGAFGPAGQGTGQGAPTAVQPAEAAAERPAPEPAASGPATSGPQADVPLLAGGIPPPAKSGGGAGSDSTSDGSDGSDVTETTGLGPDTGKHRRGLATAGPGRDDDAGASSGPGRRSRGQDGKGKDGPGRDDKGKDGKKKRKGSFWRELPLLVVVAIVLTFVIQTFVARIYVIPSASMEQTLHGCTGCANDRVAVDKVSYRFGDPSPGDVVVFKGPPAWLDNEEVGDTQPSGNPIVRGFQDALSLVGLAAPNEKDFVKRVIAVGGQTIACCDASNRVLVDGKPLTEPYLYYQSGLGDQQATFDPVRVPEGQLWVMGDNRNNSADARFHGPVPLDDVIGKVRVVVLPVTRWRTVPAIDPQATATALGPEQGLPSGVPAVAGALLAVPVVWGGRRLRHALVPTTGTGPPEPGPAGRRGAPPQ
ncbi:signal peptidase I [Actinomycetospora atypica]|uniref:Signal peptidase I n=1 Tax=Actinomycetospora atypica TaxID=1290095 RepID=A0ABV9YWA7_9PSEU